MTNKGGRPRVFAERGGGVKVAHVFPRDLVEWARRRYGSNSAWRDRLVALMDRERDVEEAGTSDEVEQERITIERELDAMDARRPSLVERLAELATKQHHVEQRERARQEANDMWDKVVATLDERATRRRNIKAAHVYGDDSDQLNEQRTYAVDILTRKYPTLDLTDVRQLVERYIDTVVSE